MPSEIADQRAVISLCVTDQRGGLLREFRPDGRGHPVSLAAVSPFVTEALIAIEDRHFFRHPGINPLALLRAGWENVSSGTIVGGGSTLTMQAARALRGRQGRTWWNKLAEMHLALRLEIHLSKSDILQLWLNRASFGNAAYGIESAARLYFGKSARDLTRAEAAYLVGLPQSPSRYNPFRHPERASARQERVLAALQQAGRVTPEERAHLAQLPVPLQAPQPLFRAPHFTTWLAGEHAAGDVPLHEIRTTIDPWLQQAVEDLMRGHLRSLETSGVSNAAAVVLDNRTGSVLAYAGSVDFWDDRTGGQNDGVRMLRQPGSTLKPFTYALALSSGHYTPASILADIELQVPEAGGAFSPQNYDRQFRGPVPLRQALASSYNVPAVRLAREIGPPQLLRTLRAAGFASLQRSESHYGVGLTLGNGEVRLLELARAYAGLANGGRMPAIRSVAWVRTARGDTLVLDAPRLERIGLDPQVAFLVTHILQDPEARAPAFGRGGPLELPFPCAVKTGTSKDYRDNWAVGYTPRHTVAVWTGNFDGKPMRWVSGVTGAAPLLKSIFLQLGPGGDFIPPGGLLKAAVCPESGARPGSACTRNKTELFLAGTVPTDTCQVHRLVRIDRRTGLLASHDTPPADVVPTLYTVYPEEFHPWMRTAGLALPPHVTAAELAAGVFTSGDSLHFTDRLQVQYPETGMRFQLDPTLRLEYQRIHLRGAAREDLFDVSWWINSQRVEADYRDADFALHAGTYQIELRAIGADGQRFRSRPITIQVDGGF